MICSTLENIKVAIRVRPFLRFENDQTGIIFIDPDDERKIKIGKELNYFEGIYDKIFGYTSTQAEIFEFVQSGIDDLTKGINCTIFTYGQTGSGKTYTMFGSDWTLNVNSGDYSKIISNLSYDSFNFIQNEIIINPFSENNGIIPRMINHFFSDRRTEMENQKYSMKCSYIQIYNEKVYDLLQEEDIPQMAKFNTYVKELSRPNPIHQKPLIIWEDKKEGVYLEGLSEFIVENVYDCLNLLKRGEKNRKKRQTNKNELSSRSHTIFIIIIEGGIVDHNGHLKKAKLHFCDLAGSEKYDKQEDPKSVHFSEMVNINMSLATLGNVIHALSTKKSHIPYRDSKLTRLLQDSLGGNTRTYFIANLSPALENYDESLSTLKFADRARSVLSKVQPNEIVAFDDNLIKKLTEEIQYLKEILNFRKKRGTLGSLEDQYLKLKEENLKLKQFVMTNENVEKLIKENTKLKLDLQKLSKGDGTETPLKDSVELGYNQNSKIGDVSHIAEENKYSIPKQITDSTGSGVLSRVGEDIIFRGVTSSVKQSSSTFQRLSDAHNNLKASNMRLKMLEELEKKNEQRAIKSLAKLRQEKLSKMDLLFQKKAEREERISKMRGHIGRLNYLYQESPNVYSSYLLESTTRNENRLGDKFSYSP